MENEVKEITPINPEENEATPIKETAENADTTYKQNLVINNFPRDLYDKMYPAFEAWNSKRMPKLKFGHYVIHLLGDEEGTAQTIAKLRERNHELDQQNQQADGRISELQSIISEKKERIDELENEVSEESSAKEHHHLRVVGLESQIKALQAQPVPVPVAPAIPGQYSEKGMLAGMQAVMDKAAELSSPGIFNRFQTFTREQYQAVFQEAYAKALQS